MDLESRTGVAFTSPPHRIPAGRHELGGGALVLEVAEQEVGIRVVLIHQVPHRLGVGGRPWGGHNVAHRRDHIPLKS
jgi:hypothetical protein